MIRIQKMKETNKTEIRNMFKAIQEEEEEPPEMVDSSDEEEEEEEGKKECSALFWEEDQELSPLIAGMSGESGRSSPS
eukprot:1250948-Karenia_brevis.AAC.1